MKEGLIGVGEATAGLQTKPVEVQVQEVCRFVIGQDPLQPEQIWQQMHKGLFLKGSPAMSAIEILAGTFLKCATLEAAWWETTSTPTRLRKRVVQHSLPRPPAAQVKEKGYTALKFDPFGAGYRFFDAAEERLSLELVRVVREAVGDDVNLLIEGHDLFSVSTAIRIGKQLEEFRPMWFEPPVMSTDIDATIAVAQAIPMAVGERYDRLRQFIGVATPSGC